MNQQLERIMESPNSVKLGILSAGVVLIAIVYWFCFHQSVQEELSKISEEVNSKTNEIAEKRGIAQRLPEFEAEVARLDVELKKALAELPDKKEIYQLLEKVADKAKEAGLDIRLFKPRGEQKKDFYAEVPVEIEVGGGYHQVASFFDEVGHMERIVNIEQFSMTEPKQGELGMNLKTSLVATSFRFLDENERPKDEKKGSARRKRKAANADDE